LRLCLWSGSDFTGTRRTFRPVGPGECLKIGDSSSGFSSAYNLSENVIRLWETSQETKDGTLCLGRSGTISPGQAVRRFSFGVADGLGDAP
jgi:hypothetical protein